MKKYIHLGAAIMAALVLATSYLPCGFAADAPLTHRVEVRQNEGYTADRVGVNIWPIDDGAQSVTFHPQTGYVLQSLTAQAKASGTAIMRHSRKSFPVSLPSCPPARFACRCVTQMAMSRCFCHRATRLTISCLHPLPQCATGLPPLRIAA